MDFPDVRRRCIPRQQESHSLWRVETKRLHEICLGKQPEVGIEVDEFVTMSLKAGRVVVVFEINSRCFCKVIDTLSGSHCPSPQIHHLPLSIPSIPISILSPPAMGLFHLPPIKHIGVATIVASMNCTRRLRPLELALLSGFQS